MIKVSRLHRIDNGSSLKAFADVVVDNQVLIKGVRILIGDNHGLYVTMPKQQSKNGKWFDSVKLLDDLAKEELQDVVLEAYNA